MKKYRIVNKLKDYAYQKKILPSHKGYSRFLVMGMGRTGTNMLVSSLRTNHAIICFGELFNHSTPDRIGYGQSNRAPHISMKKAREIRANEPIEFLEKCVFRYYPREIGAVGFKLFYWQCQQTNWKIVWNYFKSMPDLKVIHLRRRNILKTLLSLKRVQRDKIWSTRKEEKKDRQEPIRIEYEKCIEAFTDWPEREKYFEDYFKDKDVYNITYEDFCTDYQNHTKALQEFIEVKPVGLKPLTKKQRKNKLSKLIENYWELKEKFKGRPEEKYFED